MKEGGRFEVKIFSEVVTTVYFIAGLLNNSTTSGDIITSYMAIINVSNATG